MRAKRPLPRGTRHDKRWRADRLRALHLWRPQPAIVTLAFAANHLVSLGQARDEMERKA